MSNIKIVRNLTHHPHPTPHPHPLFPTPRHPSPLTPTPHPLPPPLTSYPHPSPINPLPPCTRRVSIPGQFLKYDRPCVYFSLRIYAFSMRFIERSQALSRVLPWSPYSVRSCVFLWETRWPRAGLWIERSGLEPWPRYWG